MAAVVEAAGIGVVTAAAGWGNGSGRWLKGVEGDVGIGSGSKG